MPASMRWFYSLMRQILLRQFIFEKKNYAANNGLKIKENIENINLIKMWDAENNKFSLFTFE
jgi:hypothetical protein